MVAVQALGLLVTGLQDTQASRKAVECGDPSDGLHLDTVTSVTSLPLVLQCSF